MALSVEATERFLDALGPEVEAALYAIKRRAENDYSHETSPNRFPRFEAKKVAGLTVWGAFEAWIEERRPGAATVNRWRAVMLDLTARFGDHDIASITEADALEWTGTLVAEDRFPQVAK